MRRFDIDFLNDAAFNDFLDFAAELIAAVDRLNTHAALPR